jgi:hypothetical protein
MKKTTYFMHHKFKIHLLCNLSFNLIYKTLEFPTLSYIISEIYL